MCQISNNIKKITWKPKDRVLSRKIWPNHNIKMNHKDNIQIIQVFVKVSVETRYATILMLSDHQILKRSSEMMSSAQTNTHTHRGLQRDWYTHTCLWFVRHHDDQYFLMLKSICLLCSVKEKNLLNIHLIITLNTDQCTMPGGNKYNTAWQKIDFKKQDTRDVCSRLF